MKKEITCSKCGKRFGNSFGVIGAFQMHIKYKHPEIYPYFPDYEYTCVKEKKKFNCVDCGCLVEYNKGTRCPECKRKWLKAYKKAFFNCMKAYTNICSKNQNLYKKAFMETFKNYEVLKNET